jgi:hypothetical protein
MNARKVVRDTLIRKKLIYWRNIAHNPDHYKNVCPPSRARKNYWRLCSRYPEIMLKLGWDEGDVY